MEAAENPVAGRAFADRAVSCPGSTPQSANASLPISNDYPHAAITRALASWLIDGSSGGVLSAHAFAS